MHTYQIGPFHASVKPRWQVNLSAAQRWWRWFSRRSLAGKLVLFAIVLLLVRLVIELSVMNAATYLVVCGHTL